MGIDKIQKSCKEKGIEHNNGRVKERNRPLRTNYKRIDRPQNQNQTENLAF